MGVVGPEFSGAGLQAVVVAASLATWVVLIFVALLVLIGIALIITALWVLQNAEDDPEALAPLEVMGSRRFRTADSSDQKTQLAEARPRGAGGPAPILTTAAVAQNASTQDSSTQTAQPSTGSTDSTDSEDRTTGTRRIRRYRAGDRPPSADDADAQSDAQPAADSTADDKTSKRSKRKTNAKGGRSESRAGSDDLVGDADDNDAAADEHEGEDDWWLDLDDEAESGDQAEAEGAAELDATPAGRRTRRSDSDGDQSYLDVLADWETDPESTWSDEPDWTSAGRRPGRARPSPNSQRVENFDDDYDDYDDDYEDYDDDYEDDPEYSDYDDAMGLVPERRRGDSGRSSDRWRRDTGGGRLASRNRSNGLDDDYDYDEQDSDMDFDDNDYEDFTPEGSTTPGSDPFFDDDFDGPWDPSPQQRGDRRPRRTRNTPAGGGRARRRVPSANMNTFEPEAMVDRFRQRAAAVRRRPLPPVAGEERQEFIRQAKIDYQDFAMIGDAEVSIEDGVLVLRLDLRAD